MKFLTPHLGLYHNFKGYLWRITVKLENEKTQLGTNWA
jgi:hypothetical protein